MATRKKKAKTAAVSSRLLGCLHQPTDVLHRTRSLILLLGWRKWKRKRKRKRKKKKKAMKMM
jgi:hypothetical protein